VEHPKHWNKMAISTKNRTEQLVVVTRKIRDGRQSAHGQVENEAMQFGGQSL
jgi:hypothetical protein